MTPRSIRTRHRVSAPSTRWPRRGSFRGSFAATSNQGIYCATIGRRSEVIKLLDFGIAKIIDDAERQASLTGKGYGRLTLLRTRAGADRPVTPRQTCLVGLIAYGLTGHRPFSESRPMAAMMARVDPPAPMSIDGERGGRSSTSSLSP